MQAGGSKLRASTSGNLRTWIRDVRREAQVAVDLYREAVVLVLTERVLSRTPVWEGETIVNWRWSVGAPAGGHLDPVGGVEPGHTSGMALGEEPRRASNEAVVLASMRAALAQVRGTNADLWLTNTGDIADLVEYGGAPTPETTRAPGGALRLAVREVIAGML